MKILTEFTDELLTNWPEIEFCRERKKTSIPFIRQIISRYGNDTFVKSLNILDAAAGLGCEALELIISGYRVTYNEPDSRLFKKFRSILQDGITWDIESHNNINQFSIINKINKNARMEAYNLPWNYLKHVFYGEYNFNIILALGNFIAHLENKQEDLLNYLDILKKVCKPGGLIIFDHRNFYKLRRSIELGEKNSVNHYIASYTKRFENPEAKLYMYCSKKIIALPRKKLSNDKIEFVFVQIEDNKNKLIDTFPDGRNKPSCVQMVELDVKFVCKKLIEIGFENISIYSDYDLSKKIQINECDKWEITEEKISQFEKLNENDYFVYVAELK